MVENTIRGVQGLKQEGGLKLSDGTVMPKNENDHTDTTRLFGIIS